MIFLLYGGSLSHLSMLSDLIFIDNHQIDEKPVFGCPSISTQSAHFNFGLIEGVRRRINNLHLDLHHFCGRYRKE